MEYEYFEETVLTKSLEIEDVGQCCVKCENTQGDVWYLCVQSVDGMCMFIKFGPVYPGSDTVAANFSLMTRTCKFSTKTIDKEIDSFINDKQKGEIEATCVDLTEALEAIPVKEMFILE